MVIKVDKDIPLPYATRRGAYFKYPWSSMDVGDSFYVDGVPTATGAVCNFASTVYHHNRTHPKTKFTCRREGSGFRVWRTK